MSTLIHQDESTPLALQEASSNPDNPFAHIPVVKTGSALLDRFIGGFDKFHARNYRCECCHRDIGRCFQKGIDHGQHPKALVLYCSDSRSNSSDLFAAEAGEVFSNSTVATLVPPQSHYEGSATWAAIEFAIEHLHVPAIILLGHTQCGGIKALVESADNGERIQGALGHWLEEAQGIIASAERRYQPQSPAARLAAVEMENIVWGYGNIKTYLDRVFANRPEKRPELHGLLFNMGLGNIYRLSNGETGTFEPLTLLPIRTDRGKTPPECPAHSAALFAPHPALANQAA